MTEKLIDELEFHFNLFDASVSKCERIKTTQFNKEDLTESIELAFNTNESLIRSSINEQREKLLETFKNSIHLNLKELQSFESFKCSFLVFVTKSDQLIKRLGQCLIGNLYYRHDFDMLKKFKYLNLFDRLVNEVRHFQPQNFRLCHLINQCSTQSVISCYHLLVYTQPNKDETYLKIINEKLEELHVLALNPKMHLRETQCFDKKILVLFWNQVARKFELCSYSSHLKLLASRTFDFKARLMPLTQSEVLCWSPDQKELTSFDYNLVKKETCGQARDENEPFYFGNGNLTDVNGSFILFYSDLEELDYGSITGEKEMHFIKIVSRQTGCSVGEIKFEYNYFTRILKLDMNDNIIFKPHMPNNLIECYRTNGEKTNDFTNGHFRDIESPRLTSNNQIVFFNRREDKVEII